MNIKYFQLVIPLALTIITGCSSLKNDTIYYVHEAISDLNYSQEIAKIDPLRKDEYETVSMPDYDIDNRIAGEKEQGEIALLLRYMKEEDFIDALDLFPDPTKAFYEILDRHQYPDISLVKISKPKNYTEQQFMHLLLNKRISKLDSDYKLLHKVDTEYVFKHCKLIVANNQLSTHVGGIYVYDKSEYEDLYLNRSWMPLVSLYAAQKYATIVEPNLTKGAGQLKGTDRQPTHVFYGWRKPYDDSNDVYGSFMRFIDKTNLSFMSLFPEKPTLLTYFQCTPEQHKEARKAYFIKHPEYKDQAIQLRKDLNLEPEEL